MLQPKFKLDLIYWAEVMKEMKEATMQEMMDNLVPIHVRDSCANVLIPLNKWVFIYICIQIYFVTQVLFFL